MYLTAKEMAEQLKVSEKTIRRKIWNGELPYFKIGESVRVDQSDFEAYIASTAKRRESTATEAQ